MGQRHARRQHQRIETAPVGVLEIAHREALLAGLHNARFGIVPRRHIGAARHQRAHGIETRPRQPEDGDGTSLECGDGDHRGYLNFSVDRPTSASTIAMIQNRTTICGSFQPSCSKW